MRKIRELVTMLRGRAIVATAEAWTTIINSSGAKNVTTVSTRDAIWANSSENFNVVPPATCRRIDSILSDTVKCSPKTSRKSSRASTRLIRSGAR
jgi:hypothetical protein